MYPYSVAKEDNWECLVIRPYVNVHFILPITGGSVYVTLITQTLQTRFQVAQRKREATFIQIQFKWLGEGTVVPPVVSYCVCFADLPTQLPLEYLKGFMDFGTIKWGDIYVSEYVTTMFDSQSTTRDVI